MFDHLFLLFFFLIVRRPPRSKRTDTLFPYTTLFRSKSGYTFPAEFTVLVQKRISDYRGARASEAARQYRREINKAFTDASTIAIAPRSEEHTSELQSLMRISYAVFCLKKKNKQNRQPTHTSQEQ